MSKNQDTAIVEVFVRIDGSLVSNRLTSFEMPIVSHTNGVDGGEGAIQFETKTLVNSIVKAVKKLI